MVDKFELLENQYDVCGGSKTTNFNIHDASTQTGKCPMMKVLQTNSCIHDCKYCANSSKKTKKAAYNPVELAKTFMQLKFKHKLEGLFLSSAVPKDPEVISEKMIQTMELLRYVYNYKGYIHFKVLPGVSKHIIKEAAKFCDRMSINIEAPSKSRMNELSSTKDYKIDIIKRQFWIKKYGKPQSTQMIVGAGGESDKEVLSMMAKQYEIFDHKRIYYSSFVPVKDTSLENKTPESIIRRNRLYNSDFLYRKFSFSIKEMMQILNDDDMLPREDPKIALAKKFFDSRVEINEADYSDLIRVPGIGLKSAQKIIAMRKTKKIKRQRELHSFGVVLSRATPFIKIDGGYQKSLLAEPSNTKTI